MPIHSLSSKPPPTKPITVSIVSHGQLALIRPLLEQLDRWSHAAIEKVVLTINVPEEDVVADLTGIRFPVVRIENRHPRGSGANHNQAFKLCATAWFLVLNPDIRLDCDVLTPLLAQASKKSGLLAPRIWEPGKSAPEQHRAVITPIEILTRRRPTYPRQTAPAWIPGLFMLFRSEAYANVTGFDERFFMYGEDFDICARLGLAGWSLQIAERVNARHEAQRASHSSRKHLWWHVSSLMKVWGSPAFWRYKRHLERPGKTLR